MVARQAQQIRRSDIRQGRLEDIFRCLAMGESEAQKFMDFIGKVLRMEKSLGEAGQYLDSISPLHQLVIEEFLRLRPGHLQLKISDTGQAHVDGFPKLRRSSSSLRNNAQDVLQSWKQGSSIAEIRDQYRLSRSRKAPVDTIVNLIRYESNMAACRERIINGSTLLLDLNDIGLLEKDAVERLSKVFPEHSSVRDIWRYAEWREYLHGISHRIRNALVELPNVLEEEGYPKAAQNAKPAPIAQGEFEFEFK